MVQLIPEGLRRMVGGATALETGTREAVVLSVAAQKGGVGKTTTAVNLAYALARFHDLRVLLVDIDSQGHVASALYRLVPPTGGEGLSDILLGKKRDIFEVARPTRLDGLHVTPSDRHLNETEGIIGARIGKELLLRQASRVARTHFDAIIIDCPPNLGNLTLNALLASSHVLIPSDMSVLSLQGVHDLVDALETVRERLGHDVKLAGLLRTRVDGRNRTVNEAILEALEQDYGPQLLKTQIPVNTALAKSQLEGRAVFDYAPASTGAAAYRDLALEISWRLGLSARGGPAAASHPG